MNVESSGPTNTEFRSSANLICTTAKSSLAATNRFDFQQRIEGQNLQAIKKGTSAAESLTVSFYVKSSNTGTYICEFVDTDNTRQISKSYTINTANTWEKKTITIPPDTTGLFDNDNANSLQLNFYLAAGSDRSSGTLNDSAWASVTTANRAVGQLNLANASGNYWAVTGIQLETGEVATPFEMRSFGQELTLCQRYFQRFLKPILRGVASTSTNLNRLGRPTLVEMRSSPSLVLNGTLDWFDGSVVGTFTTIGTAHVTPQSVEIDAVVATGSTSISRPITVFIGSSTGSLDASSEL
jgi:hypothetical protein